EEVREKVRVPFSNYLKSAFDLINNQPWAFPAFKQPSQAALAHSTCDPNNFTKEDMDALLDHAFDRYFETSGLFGTPASCRKTIEILKANDIDEVACLIDFGV